MTTPHRRRILGDLEANAPERWEWGGPGGPPVDVALLLYAPDGAGALSSSRTGTCAGSRAAGSRCASGSALRPGRLRALRLPRRDLAAVRRGPVEDGPGRAGLCAPASSSSATRTSTASTRTARCSTRPPTRRARSRATPQGSGRADLGRNGSYLVLRQLRQDVPGFWHFVDDATRRPDGTRRPGRARPARREDGRPLAERRAAGARARRRRPHPRRRERLRLPRARPARRALPGRRARAPLATRATRSTRGPGSGDSWAINRRHRILRRGREYGTSLTIDEAVAGGDATERGLNFICLNANIQRQFEFVNHTWLNNPKFDRLYDDADPVTAPSAPFGGTFTIPAAGVRERVTDVPRFVSVKGGAYFFLPGLAALRYLAGIGGEPGNSSSPVGS